MRKENRSELHCHTNISGMASPVSPDELLKRAKELGLTAIAVTDMGSVQAFPALFGAAKRMENPPKIIYGYEGYISREGKSPCPVTLLVKTQKGMKSLYRLVSYANTHKDALPVIPEQLLSENREGLLIGAAAFSNTPETECDFLEVTPAMDPGIVMKAVETSSVPVLAAGDVRYLDEDDVEAAKAYAYCYKLEADQNAEAHVLKNTDEMLAHFSFLGLEKAYEIVVKNTGDIAGLIEDVTPISPEKYPVRIAGAEKKVREICENRARMLYGEKPPALVSERLNTELQWIEENRNADLYYLSKLLIDTARTDGYPVGSRGSAAASFVSYLLGISEINPLPAHFRCECGFFEQISPNKTGSHRTCPNCGKELISDGFNLPVETFLGFDGKKEPDFDFNFPSEYQKTAIKNLSKLPGVGGILRAGTIGTVTERTAKSISDTYIEETGFGTENIADRLVGAKRSDAYHPGGVLVIPENIDINDITPISLVGGENTSHFSYHDIDESLYKFDILAHDTPEKLHQLILLTGVSPENSEIGDEKILQLFSEGDTSGIPEFDSKPVLKMLEIVKPENTDDLIRIVALAHSTDGWEENGKALIENGTATLSEIISTRDDIVLYLIERGFDRKNAFKIAENVRKGKAYSGRCCNWPVWVQEMKDHGVPEWYIRSCEKICYLFPRAHAASYVLFALKMAYYKVYFPEAFEQVINDYKNRPV